MVLPRGATAVVNLDDPHGERVAEAAEDAGEAMTSVSSPTSGMTKSSPSECAP